MSHSGKYEVTILFNGYARNTEQGMLANCTCTLLKGPKTIIVDTMTAWDGEKLVAALKEQNVECSDIDYVICTHGHSDHLGCNYLFPKATHIVGTQISHKDMYYNHDFEKDVKYVIDDHVTVMATPGHTLQDVTVLVERDDGCLIAITGDLFENESDLTDDNIWISAGSDSVELQRKNRNQILEMAHWIVPGHGPMFKNNRIMRTV